MEKTKKPTNEQWIEAQLEMVNQMSSTFVDVIREIVSSEVLGAEFYITRRKEHGLL